MRDESEQVRYMRDLIPILDQVGVEIAFWFTFAGYRLPHRRDPHFDLDLASFGVVKMLNDEDWEPKEAFFSLADLYARDKVYSRTGASQSWPVRLGMPTAPLRSSCPCRLGT